MEIIAFPVPFGGSFEYFWPRICFSSQDGMKSTSKFMTGEYQVKLGCIIGYLLQSTGIIRGGA
jgi:hypothetical protein